MIYGGIQFLDPRRKGIAEINMATATFYRSLARARGHRSREGGQMFSPGRSSRSYGPGSARLGSAPDVEERFLAPT